ncbi:hypothetical protein [Pseudoxanthomonas winnipegensis]|uniref:hypothetical protein n=1 Tax=Pseudoxanthomonas winnipegensis TaxID=2480810 RepID=UPI00102DBF9B|nr:hypothetical protein [Pseudoxanthomonas winnipegensis]RZZ85690.1 hypothetical protein EA663_11825 [Pseudoxanthomonas winnipegensis]
MADPYFELGAQLGNLATGGWRDNSHKAYYDQLGRVGQAEGLLAQARSRRAQALIDEGQQQQIGRWAADPAAAAAELGTTPGGIGVLLGGGGNAAQLATALGTLGETGFRRDAAQRATLGDWNGANAALMGVANGPVQLGTVEGQNLLQNRLLVGGGGISTTEQGQAGIAADAARARAADASAASSYASAARTRQAMGIDAEQFGLERAGKWNPGGKPAANELGKPLSAPTINKLASDAEELQNLTTLGDTFNNDFAGNGAGGQMENLLGRMGWEGGITGATPGQADWWQQYDRQKNVIRNKLFGAALTPSEQAEFDKADINPNMSAQTIRNNLANQTAIIQRGLQRQARTWQAQGYNVNALREATGLEDFGGGRTLGDSPAPASAPVQRARNPKTGQTLVVVNGQWVPE